MEQHEAEEILRTLVRIAGPQETINADIRASLLARRLHAEPNGREA